ncbi:MULTISPECIES: A24 family peptidase [Dehalobacter]|jgi:leader peptidase (prepilin peptidase)/N-methyltransferase|uniref:Prepilin peptidase n=2 Tax=Dehalobacter restrictus TaxID=55583 RepID=A0A857DIE3_9FIRM|nr:MULTISPECIES: A24 family peptidase [Dehalobacter]AHF09657.1 peptidase A24 [Dehalobacter restrictus DSM 9455]MCG1026511.1 prepilin peptidase [Dehalobacter sp.]MDJ0304298.1 A24 family peptidase [Dehalobacter sp.]OCZ55007.1 peptidase [Dehalobacter sp. TeCB1]QHA00252.1 prepilin peptidase [Dehalobacter restrictus]
METFFMEHVWLVYLGLFIVGLAAGKFLKILIRRNMEEEHRDFPSKPVVEILNALLYCALFWKYGFSLETLSFLIFGSILLLIAFIDFKTMLIPNWSVLLILVLGILFAFFNQDVSWLERLIGFFGAGLGLLLIYIFSRGGIGGGDIKLMAAAGFFLGWKLTFWAMLVGSIIGGVFGVIILVSGKGQLKTAIPYGPFLVIGIIGSILFGNEMISWYWSLLIR